MRSDWPFTRALIFDPMPYSLAVRALGTKVNADQPSDQVKKRAHQWRVWGASRNCLFGFATTFEPTDRTVLFWSFRIAYAVIGPGCVAGVERKILQEVAVGPVRRIDGSGVRSHTLGAKNELSGNRPDVGPLIRDGGKMITTNLSCV